ncbi:MAG: MMCAP2_0565 family pilin-like conjugal transfer protein [Candidatus Saccharibacteria bacterium]
MIDKIVGLLAATTPITAANTGIPVVPGDQILPAILGIVYWTAGIVAVVVIIIAGIMFATSDGDPGKVKRAREAILYSIVGIVIILVAFTITNFIAGRFV